jgi:uncharacterized protein (DUF1330 family)
MAAYLIGNVQVTDAALFADYGRQVPAVVAAYGGRYLVRGGATEVLEGAFQPTRTLVIEFSDMARLRAFYDSAEYRPLLALRQRAAVTSLFAVEGVAPPV